jgi:hypothetical protein
MIAGTLKRHQSNHVQAPQAMLRVWRRWPLMLALRPWWEDPSQAAAMIMAAGCLRTGEPVWNMHQRQDKTIRGGYASC